MNQLRTFLLLLFSVLLFQNCSEDIQTISAADSEIEEKTTDPSNARASGCNPNNIQGCDHGKVWGIDPRSGSLSTGQVLTDRLKDDHLIYYTHNSWSYDGKWIIFTSTRDGGRNNVFALNMPGSADNWPDYTIVQLTDHDGFPEGGSTENVVVSRYRNYLYYVLGTNNNQAVALVELDFGSLLNDALSGNVRESWRYDRVIRTYTSGGPKPEGGVSLSYNEQYLFAGLSFGNQSKIERVTISSGASHNVHTTYNWWVTHIVANQHTSSNNEVMFAHRDTDRKNRKGQSNTTPVDIIFVVNGDGSNKRVVGRHSGGSRATHFTWVNSNTIGYNRSSGSLQGYRHVDSYGRNDRLVASFPTSYLEYIHNTRIAGTNDYILDVANGGGKTLSLWKVNGSTGQRQALPFMNFGACHAHQTTSRDGQWLLFESRPGAHSLTLMRL